MKYTKEQVLHIVDICFHAYASSYRNEAKTEATEIMQKIQDQNTSSNTLSIVYVVVDVDFDIVNCWGNKEAADKHAKELSEASASEYSVIIEPVFTTN